MSRKYERKNKKNYHQWVLDHKSEILELPSKQRTDYVMGKLNDELNLNMQRYNVYQLLYRNGWPRNFAPKFCIKVFLRQKYQKFLKMK